MSHQSTRCARVQSRNLPYAAAKGGMISATTVMAVHHGRDNIRVNCIAPGASLRFVSCTVSERSGARTAPVLSDRLARKEPAWDVAWATVFLASDESKWISGVTIRLMRGYSPQRRLRLCISLTNKTNSPRPGRCGFPTAPDFAKKLPN